MVESWIYSSSSSSGEEITVRPPAAAQKMSSGELLQDFRGK